MPDNLMPWYNIDITSTTLPTFEQIQWPEQWKKKQRRRMYRDIQRAWTAGARQRMTAPPPITVPTSNEVMDWMQQLPQFQTFRDILGQWRQAAPSTPQSAAQAPLTQTAQQAIGGLSGLAQQFGPPTDFYQQAWGAPATQQLRTVLAGMGAPGQFAQMAQQTPIFQQAQQTASRLASPEVFQQSIAPIMRQTMARLGRAGTPSSSFADRLIASTLGEAWARHLGGAGQLQTRLAQTLPGMAGMYMAPAARQLTGYERLLYTMPGQMGAMMAPLQQQAGVLGQAARLQAGLAGLTPQMMVAGAQAQQPYAQQLDALARMLRAGIPAAQMYMAPTAMMLNLL